MLPDRPRLGQTGSLSADRWREEAPSALSAALCLATGRQQGRGAWGSGVTGRWETGKGSCTPLTSVISHAPYLALKMFSHL